MIFFLFLLQHDPEQCTPGGEDGNYIMFARATSGDKRNNNKFSPCSLKAIEPVLNAKARSAKGCFTGNVYILYQLNTHTVIHNIYNSAHCVTIFSITPSNI